MTDIFRINTDFLDAAHPVFVDCPLYKGVCSVYTIQKGDTLSSISAAFGTTMKAITDLNNVPNPNKIGVGQKLVIPGVKK